jgi:hypothetical protein
MSSKRFKDPEYIPLDTDYASVIEADGPIVVQHTRRSRQAELAFLSTIVSSSDAYNDEFTGYGFAPLGACARQDDTRCLEGSRLRLPPDEAR